MTKSKFLIAHQYPTYRLIGDTGGSGPSSGSAGSGSTLGGRGAPLREGEDRIDPRFFHVGYAALPAGAGHVGRVFLSVFDGLRLEGHLFSIRRRLEGPIKLGFLPLL